MKTTFKLMTLVVISCFTMLQISCKSDDDSGDECEEAVCPTVFITIDVYIIDENQAPVALDSYEVIDLANGEVLNTPMSPEHFEYYQESGQYPMISDGQVQLNQVIDIQFKGFINDIEVISSDYKVTADCCHVGLVSGDTNLVLE